jgi:hypothetical protein
VKDFPTLSIVPDGNPHNFMHFAGCSGGVRAKPIVGA